MAMFIKLARGSDIEVQLGNALPNSVVNDLQNVTAVQASDKELERLQKIFYNCLPTPHGRKTVTYVGDTARFIVANWMTGKHTED